MTPEERKARQSEIEELNRQINILAESLRQKKNKYLIDSETIVQVKAKDIKIGDYVLIHDVGPRRVFKPVEQIHRTKKGKYIFLPLTWSLSTDSSTLPENRSDKFGNKCYLEHEYLSVVICPSYEEDPFYNEYVEDYSTQKYN